MNPEEARAFLQDKIKWTGEPGNLEEKAISLIGIELYEAFIKGYTIKHWGCDPKDLPAEIITRLPIRNSYYDSYYDDLYQGIPIGGYGRFFENILCNIPHETGIDFLVDREYWRNKCTTLVYTGPIDEYFQYSLGNLQWRSVRFEIEKIRMEDYQGTSVMNFADLEIPWTRIHEPKHLHRERQFAAQTTIIIREYPAINHSEHYYPVNTRGDQLLLTKYKELEKQERNTIFGGRLAEYRYYDMHQVIASAISKYQTARKNERSS